MFSNLFRRRYLISLTYLLIVVIGIIAWREIPLEQAPELNLPAISVSYSWNNTSPEVMEKEVTRQVEQAANRLRDVEKIESVSQEGRSSVTVTFNKNAPVDYRVAELQEYLFTIRETLPPSVRQGSISRRVPQELQELQTFVVYSLSGDRPTRDLLEYARQNIRLPLLGIEGLSDVEINGAREPALTVAFDINRLEQYGINQQQVMSDIKNNLQWRSSGYIQNSGRRVSLLVTPQFEGLEEIRNMKIKIPESRRQIRLSDIARVSIQDYPANSLKRINGSPALSVEFLKESGADAIGLAERIRSRMQEVEQKLPADMFIQLERDATEDLRRQFGDLQYQAMISLLVVFLILLIFIRRFRAPFVILGSILFSLLLSVSILYFVDYTLNVITLAGLTVALGMIIDNAVVVFEQLNPRLPEGRNARVAHVKKHLPRTLVPVLGSTFTTVGIFIPVFFAMEELQIFLEPLAVALSFTLISSVFIALSWIPYALIWLVPAHNRSSENRNESQGAGQGLFGYIRGFLLRIFNWRYRLRWVFYLVFIAMVGIPIFAIEEPDWENSEEPTAWPEFTKVYFENRDEVDPLIGGLPYRFFNEIYFGSPWGGRDQESIYINIRTPQGTPLEEIDKMARNFERIVSPYSEAFSYYETNLSEYSGARLLFYLKDEYLYEPEPYIFYAEAMYLAARTGNSAISVSGLGDGISTGFGSSSSSHRISLKGFSYDQLLELAKNIRNRLKENRRVRGVDIHDTGWYSRDDLYQYFLQLKDQELALRDISRGELINAISLDVNPVNSGQGRVELDGQRLFLVSRNINQNRLPETLMEEKRENEEVVFSLREVASLEKEKSLSQIRREDQSYFRRISVDFLGPYRLGSEYIKGVLEETPEPVGASIQYGSSGIFGFGSDENTRNLLLLLFLTVLSVWMIVSALLESWVDPLVVILAVPLSLIGIMTGALYHDLAFDRGAIAGTLLCVGVVVNNSILLMHEKQLMRSLGIHGLRSWLYVYRNKMRAVLITTLTTIGGLIPMIVFGESEFWQRLAIVVVWGLGSSTLLLLLLMGIWEKRSTIFGNQKFL